MQTDREDLKLDKFGLTFDEAIDTIEKNRPTSGYAMLNEALDIAKEVLQRQSVFRGWQPISNYTREKYDWVLIKYFDGDFECVPVVAEQRTDGKWYDHNSQEIPFDVRYFFDMQQLDK